eukprot:802592_1
MAHALFWTITFHLVTTYSFQSTPTPTSQPPTLLWSLSLGYIKVNLHSETSIATKLDFCRDMFGTSLASIHNATQQADISSEWFGCNPTHSGGDHCKIGLHDLDNDGIYTWFDGTSFNYNAWLSGEPSPPEDVSILLWTIGKRKRHQVHLLVFKLFGSGNMGKSGARIPYRLETTWTHGWCPNDRSIICFV